MKYIFRFRFKFFSLSPVYEVCARKRVDVPDTKVQRFWSVNWPRTIVTHLFFISDYVEGRIKGFRDVFFLPACTLPPWSGWTWLERLEPPHKLLDALARVVSTGKVFHTMDCNQGRGNVRSDKRLETWGKGCLYKCRALELPLLPTWWWDGAWKNRGNDVHVDDAQLLIYSTHPLWPMFNRSSQWMRNLKDEKWSQ